MGALGAVACEGFGIREGELSIQSPVSLPEDLVRGKDNWYASLCRNCPSCEGILVRVMEGRAKKIQGNPYYPTNQGKSHARCEAGVQALYHPDRISGPMKRGGNRGSGQFDPIAWDPEGMDTLTRQINDRGINAGAGRAVMVTKPMRGHLGMLTSPLRPSHRHRAPDLRGRGQQCLPRRRQERVRAGCPPRFRYRERQFHPVLRG